MAGLGFRVCGPVYDEAISVWIAAAPLLFEVFSSWYYDNTILS
jgi:hypothetical protein